MKYEIDTIPVWDALRSGEECPFCLLEKKSQDKFLRFYLGDSVMVPEIRVQVNEKGFSADYYEMLARDANKQGLALITHTHLKDMRRQQESLLKTLVKESARLESQKGLKTLTASSANLKKVLQRYRQYLQRRWDSCMIGPQVEEDLNRYAFTLLHLFRKDPDLPPALEQSKGFCLKHQIKLLEMAEQNLPPVDLGAFVHLLTKLQERNWDRLEQEIAQFTQTFSQTSGQAVTPELKDAPDRVIQKLKGPFRHKDRSPVLRRK